MATSGVTSTFTRSPGDSRPPARTIPKPHTGLRRISGAHQAASSGSEDERTPRGHHDPIQDERTHSAIAGRACTTGRSTVITASIPAFRDGSRSDFGDRTERLLGACEGPRAAGRTDSADGRDPARSSSSKRVVAAINGCGGVDTSRTHGLEIRRNRWSRALPCAAAQALQYSMSARHFRCHEKLPASRFTFGFESGKALLSRTMRTPPDR